MYKTINCTTRLTALAAVAFAALAAAPAYADTATDNLDVSAEVTSNCSVSTTPVEFGDVNVVSGADVDTTGGLSVTCTSGTTWEATANAGVNSGSTLEDRKLASGVNRLDYALYTDNFTTLWGDGTGATETFSGTGNGSAQSNTINARVPSGQGTVPIGSYTDTVLVTVTY